MRADVKKEQIQRDMKLVLEAVIEAEKQRRTSVDRAPLGVNLHQIQMELYNENNGIVLTDLPNTIVRDRLIRLEVDSKLSSEKRGRERVYTTPETKAAIEDWKKQRNQMTKDRKDRVLQLSNDLGYTVEWLDQAGYHKRATAVVMQIDDLEALAGHIDAAEDQ